jgi:hypothetical protein
LDPWAGSFSDSGLKFPIRPEKCRFRPENFVSGRKFRFRPENFDSSRKILLFTENCRLSAGNFRPKYE